MKDPFVFLVSVKGFELLYDILILKFRQTQTSREVYFWISKKKH